MTNSIEKHYENAAREQMGLDETWRLKTITAAFHADLEDQIEELDQDTELTDSERWQELNLEKSPLVWMPKGYTLITMHNAQSSESKTGFIYIGDRQET